MSKDGVSYQEVLTEAQKLGYAEANPTADVEGYDATYKLSILSSLAFHTKIPFSKVYREGITNISVIDINYGKQFDYVLKLLAIGKNTDNGIEVRVHPAFIKSSHPLASVNDSYNAVYITGDSVEDVMLYGRGAGALPTGSAIVGDVIYCATHSNYQYSTFKNTENASPSTKFIDNFESAYYIRLEAVDKSGVLAKVSSIFSKCGISVAQMYQAEQTSNSDGNVPLIFITHVTNENNVKKAIKQINAIPEMANVAAVIRVVS
jgi:homoserine dehydrogenase